MTEALRAHEQLPEARSPELLSACLRGLELAVTLAENHGETPRQFAERKGYPVGIVEKAKKEADKRIRYELTRRSMSLFPANVVSQREEMVSDDDSWWSQAACRNEDGDLFTPNSDRGYKNQKSIKAAKAICATCPVTLECLEDAIQLGDQGIRAGLTEDERRPIIRARAAQKRYN